jgi:SNF2 family DNA or RNA helicase
MLVNQNNNLFPLNYSDIKNNLPCGYIYSDIIIDGVVLITRQGSDYKCTLAGKISSKGNIRHIPVHQSGANYIIDNNIIYPLPNDIYIFYKRLIEGLDEELLTFPNILKILHCNQSALEIICDPSIYESASKKSFNYTEKNLIPELKADLYKYQDQGVSWMVDCLQSMNGLILADEMGLGKTIQVIAVLLKLSITIQKPALIVCPATLIANWFREIERFSPNLRKYIHRGSNRVSTYKKLMQTEVVITTYETLVEDVSLFRSIDWTIIVADEAQNIKNPSSLRKKALTQISRKFAIAVTGTPVENSIKDIWSLSDFVIPGILGTEADFDALYSDFNETPREVSKITSPYVLRRLVKEVANDLPERIDIDIPLELGESLSIEYDQIRKDVAARYPSSAALVATGQLQMFCAHPWLQSHSYGNENWEDLVELNVGPTSQIYTPKIIRSVEIITEAFKNSKKIILFSIFNKIGDLILKSLKDNANSDFFWGTINGSTPQEDRQQIVDHFSNYKGPSILVLNPKAAGAGLNITAATIVIHFTQVWNPAIEAQASARAHRRGQVEPVYIYRLYYQNTVEEVMLDRTLWKRSIANDAVPLSSRNKEDFRKALTVTPII